MNNDFEFSRNYVFYIYKLINSKYTPQIKYYSKKLQMLDEKIAKDKKIFINVTLIKADKQ